MNRNHIIIGFVVIILSFDSCEDHSDSTKNNKYSLGTVAIPNQVQEIKNDYITLVDLINLITSDDLDKKGILQHLQKLNQHWKYLNKDDEEMFFVKKTNKDATTELLMWHYTDLAIEYLTLSTNQFSKLSLEIKKSGFEITKTSQNKYGGQTNYYSKNNIDIMTDVTPTATTGKAGFQFFIMQKR